MRRRCKINLYTGYFAKHANQPNAVSIGGRPWWLPSLPSIPELAPSTSLLADYKKKRIGWEEYTPRYIAQLEELGISRIEDLLEDDMVLLCWEGPDKHCHRHLLAEWLRERGHDVREIAVRKRLKEDEE